MINNNETPSWLGHASTRFWKGSEMPKKKAFTPFSGGRHGGADNSLCISIYYYYYYSRRSHYSSTNQPKKRRPASDRGHIGSMYRPAEVRETEPGTSWPCATHKQARHAEFRGVGRDPPGHTTVCGGCAGAGWQSQAAKRSSGCPGGQHLTNPADPRGRIR